MFKQRLQQRLRLLIGPAALFVLVIAALVLTTGQRPGTWPREAVFDSFARLEPRPTMDDSPVAIIDIDEESLEQFGPWPWPRTALANLVTAADAAGARAVIVTTPLEGRDPLSPEIVARYWGTHDETGNTTRTIAALPTTNASLAAAAATTQSSLGVGPSPSRPTGWERADIATSNWATANSERATEFMSLPAAPVRDAIEPGFLETSLVSVSALPADPDGRVRRSPLVWSLNQTPAPSSGLAALILLDQAVDIVPSTNRLQVGGPPPAGLDLGDHTIALDNNAGIRLWLPQDISVPTVSAWRVLIGGEGWSTPLRDRVVFIGTNLPDDGRVETVTGPQRTSLIHALLTEQILTGAVLTRPSWGGAVEAALCLLLGLLAIAAAIFLRPTIAMGLSLGLSVIMAGGTFLLFKNGGLLLDPVAPIVAMLGGQLVVLLTVVGNMLIRDDAVRGAFHGALPPATMNKLQSRGGGKMLRGIRRDVVVLSCGLRLPETSLARFETRPDDFVRFTAAANDALRRTILSHGGTVDFGEDGRLLGYWNVPDAIDHPIEKACACALKMIDDMNAISEQVLAAALARTSGGSGIDEGFSEGSIEIGLACSPCFAGPVGVGSRNRYAVIGTAVRLACALRQRSSQYGPAIITDDQVFDALRHHYAFLDLDVVRTGTDEMSRNVYGLVGNPFLKASKAFRQLADTQRDLVQAWRNGDLSATTVSLQRLRGIPGVPDSYVEMIETRLVNARAQKEAPVDTSDVLPL